MIISRKSKQSRILSSCIFPFKPMRDSRPCRTVPLFYSHFQQIKSYFTFNTTVAARSVNAEEFVEDAGSAEKAG